jgi:hypothetical protein
MSYIKRGKYPIANPSLKIRDGKIHAMSKIEVYREKLRQLDDWESYLLSESRLPGPRANLELAHAVAEEGGEALFCAYLKYDEERAPTNSPEEFLAFCGVLGLGKLLVAGKQETFQHLRLKASDSRWRIREAVAFALQRLGKADMEALLYEMESWMEGNLLERRAVVAALCEPSLLKVEMFSKKVIDILESITESVLLEGNRRTDGLIALRKGLGYGWSVAIVSNPQYGKERFEQWINNPNPNIRWIIKENLKKKRLFKMDPDWVSTQREAGC